MGAEAASCGSGRHLLVSGYTAGADEAGLHRYAIDGATGTATLRSKAAGIQSPSYVMQDRGLLYAASEMPDAGGLALYALPADGEAPMVIDDIRFDGAAGTCFTLVGPGEHRLYGADYNSGSICQCALDEQGRISGSVSLIQHAGHSAPRAKCDPNFDRQRSAHVHTLSIVPGTSHVAAVDLGLDLIALYATDAEGAIVDADGDPVVSEWPLEPYVRSISVAGHGLAMLHGGSADEDCRAELPKRPAGLVLLPVQSGPRIVAYHPTLPIVAVVCELGCEVILYRIGKGGLHWEPMARYSLLDGPEDERLLSELDVAPLSAHCAFTSDGRFLYTSTRGTDRLQTFVLDGEGAVVDRFDVSSRGGTPRHFAISPDGGMLAVANQTGNDVVVFNRDGSTGRLDEALRIPFQHPSCVVWETAR